jgi:hypothetical protein
MLQKKKVQILASIRKKPKEGITWVEDKQEERANKDEDNDNKTTIAHDITRLGFSKHMGVFVKPLCICAIWTNEQDSCLIEYDFEPLLTTAQR